MSATYVDRVAPREDRRANGRSPRRVPYPSQGTSPLSRDQKAAICIRARTAFEHVFHRIPTDAQEMEAWRRTEQRTATGHDSLTTCTQGDYLPLLAHFDALRGETGRALDAHLRDATGPVRIAMHKLRAECSARGLDISWPATICRNKFKCPLDQATAKQLWNLVFDVRSSKHKPTAAKAPRPLGGPLGPLPPKMVFTKKNSSPSAPDPLAPEDNEPF